MVRALLPHLVGILGVLALAPVSVADTIYLEADFNDKPIGEPIGTGGAAVGEPVFVETTVTTVVSATPMATPSLQIHDNSNGTAGCVIFEFLDDAELTTGRVVVAADLWFQDLQEGYSFWLGVRENGGQGQSFTNLEFLSTGNVYCNDKDNALGNIGTYTTGQLFRVIIDYNMDAGTYDVYLDGVLVVDDEPHGVTTRGVGSVMFCHQSDPDLDGFYNIDALTVTDYYQATPTSEVTWGAVKCQYR